MGIEIERKFLVSSDGWRTAAHRVIPMAQGYINDMGALDRGTQNASVRVRIEGDHAALNLKSRTLGHTRRSSTTRSRWRTRAHCWRCASAA